MKMNPEVVTYLASIVSIFFIFVGMIYLHRKYFDDLFRQNLFAIRDSLFDMACDGQIAFDHPAYILMRKTINGFIRYGHRISFFRTILLVNMIRKRPGLLPKSESFHVRWAEATRNLPPDVKDRLMKIKEEVNFQLELHSFRASPLVVMLFLTLLPTAILTRIVVRLNRIAVAVLGDVKQEIENDVDSAGMVYGSCA